jgi:hypothetical protein
MTTPKILQEPVDFSLVLGGPLYQWLRRVHLSGEALELIAQRVLFFIGLTWLPLLLLSAVGGHLFGGEGMPFWGDIVTHVRFLVALPIFIFAELIVHQRIRPMLRSFLERRIISPEEVGSFNAILSSGMKVRNSVALEVFLCVVVFTAGHWVWAHKIAQQTASWFAAPLGGKLHLTLSGHWYAFVSVPVFQFILLRWYSRFLIWLWVLWRISRLELHLLPAHPDRVGGLGFLSQSCYAFAPLLFAQGALQAGMIANYILYDQATFASFKMTILTAVSCMVAAILVPLAVFMPALAKVRRDGLRAYGNLATGYVSDFNRKWLGAADKGEAFLGSADIQSLADLANSYDVVREMRLFPFDLKDIVRLAGTMLIPFAPLLLTVMPLEELIKRFLNMLF